MMCYDQLIFVCAALIFVCAIYLTCLSEVYSICFVCHSELPAPEVLITVSSTAGLGSDECLGLVLDSSSDSVTCRAGVVANLFHLPTISLLWRDGEQLAKSESAIVLSRSLFPQDLVGTQFNCTVCVEVPESGIENYCSSKTVATSKNS